MLFIQPYNGRVLDTQVIFRKWKIIWGCETFWGLLNYDGVASLRMGSLKQKFTLTLPVGISVFYPKSSQVKVSSVKLRGKS